MLFLKEYFSLFCCIALHCYLSVNSTLSLNFLLTFHSASLSCLSTFLFCLSINPVSLFLWQTKGWLRDRSMTDRQITELNHFHTRILATVRRVSSGFVWSFLLSHVAQRVSASDILPLLEMLSGLVKGASRMHEAEHMTPTNFSSNCSIRTFCNLCTQKLKQNPFYIWFFVRHLQVYISVCWVNKRSKLWKWI